MRDALTSSAFPRLRRSTARGARRGPLRGVGLTVAFYGVKALDEVEVLVAPDEIVGLIGPNGSGKTTCLNVLSGYLPMAGGAVELGGRDLTCLGPAQRARGGVIRTFQAVRLFSGLSVVDNIVVAAVSCGVSRRHARALSAQLVSELLLDEFADALGGDLPTGIMRRAGIARALAGRPEVLLMDEPAAGMNEAERYDLAQIVNRLPSKHGCAVLLVEHDLNLISSCCSRVQVLDAGRTIFEGPAAEASVDPKVVAAYFGREAEQNAA